MRSGIEKIKKALKKIYKKKNSIMIIDGSTVDSRKVLDELELIRSAIGETERISTIKVFMKGNAPEDLLKHIVDLGCHLMIAPNDIDLTISLEVAPYIYNKDINSIIIATNNVNIMPLLLRAKEENKKVIFLKTDEERTPLENVADLTIAL